MGKDINKRVVENLIKAGAFDSFGGNRRQYLAVYERIMDDESAQNKNLAANQVTIFDMMGTEERKSMEIKLPDLDEFPKDVVLQMEKEVLGIYISGHPLDDVKDVWKKNVTAYTSDFVYDPELEKSQLEDKQSVKVGGIITSVNVRLTRKKETMAVITLEDLMGTIECMVFPKAYDRLRDSIYEDRLVLISGRASTEDENDSKLIVEDVRGFDEIPKTLWLKFEDMDSYSTKWDDVHAVLSSRKGIDTVIIRVIKEDKMKEVKSIRVSANEDTVKAIEAILGAGTAVIR